MTLLEKYSKRLSLAESLYAQKHNGEKMDKMKSVAIAKCLDTTSKFLTEAYDLSGSATQRSAMGDYKKFCVALTNVALPNLIAFDLVAVSPMSALTGSISYVEYVKGTTKGASSADDLTNGVFGLGKMDVNYTGNAVVEPVADYQSGTTKVAFTPVIDGSVKLLAADGTDVTPAEGCTVAEDGTITGTATGTVAKIAYVYNNEIIPQTVLPTLKARLTNVALEAKPRRLAIYYSQLALFQAKTDYGFSLADGLGEQAVSQIAYETDSEIVDMLYQAATEDSAIEPFNKKIPTGSVQAINTSIFYAGFATKIEEYKMSVYNKTRKFMPNYMVIAPDVMPIITFVPGFEAAAVDSVTGPYMAGTINGVKVFVSPNLEASTFFFGVNQGELNATAGVYAPYMPCVPTQLLESADGTNSQGFASLYDCKVLNADLLIKGKIINE